MTATQLPDLDLRHRITAGSTTLTNLAALAASAGNLDQALAATAGLSRRQLVDAVVAAAHAIAASPAEPEAPQRRIRQQWVKQLKPRTPLGPRLYPDEVGWTDDALRAAHAAVVRSASTDPRHLEGERIYQRLCRRVRMQARRTAEQVPA